jgi:hypothetical protein
MTQNAALQEEMIPAGGIADFIMDDAEIEALEKQETIEAFGDQGIANFNSIARRMASYGRYGDDTVAHVETGELVIPKALIQGNDKLKESIFDHLRELGVEDPERYIVGSGENSINPETGLPEFFFKKIFRGIKKAVSSVAKAVKKTIKGVGKILKKAAPILLTIGLTPFVGPVYAGAISGGIGSLLNGGNLKDALRTAALGGVTGAIGAGISGGISGVKAGTGFLAGAASGVKGALNPNLLSSGFSRLGGVLTGQEAFSAREFLPKFLQDEKAVTAGAPADSIREGILPDNLAAEPIPTDQGEFFFDAPVAEAAPQNLEFKPGFAGERFRQSFDKAQLERAVGVRPTGTQFAQRGPITTGAGAPTGAAAPGAATSYTPADEAFGLAPAPSTPALDIGVPGETSILNQIKEGATKAGDYLFRGGRSGLDIAADVSKAEADYLSKMAAAGIKPTAEGLKLAAQSAQPGLLARFGPTAGLGLGAAAAGGFFDTPDPPSPEQTAAEYKRYLIAAGYPEDYSTYFYNPDGTRTEEGKKYLVAGLRAPSVASVVGDQGLMGGFDAGAMAPARTFEDGGDVFPRRTGGIGPNEGTPNEDSVRAMLMPGEFVMTTDAVRGADPTGQGNLNNGISTMYDMMSNLEMRGRAAA